jgi:hypothetical protein
MGISSWSVRREAIRLFGFRDYPFETARTQIQDGDSQEI